MGAPQGSAPPPPPMWMPMPVQNTPASRPIPWSMLVFLARILGFVLLFIGTLIVILGASIWGGCFTAAASCANTGWISGVLNYIIAGKILWAIGLLALGGGAGMKLHWSLQMPAQGRPEEINFIARERWANYAVLLVCVLLLAVLLLTVNQWPAAPVTGIP
ncbi:MAG TPA: hypothetical protein VEY07_03425 [Thermoplasmata archaeon]|nr:hypothetical protein [Thermoplasmata archaeon]